MGLAIDAIYAAAAAAACPVWGYRLLRTGKWRTDWPARLGKCPALPVGHGRRLLIHAVSVGEVNAVRLLVDKLCDGDDRLEIVISSTTDTGMARARSLFEPKHTVVRYPLDFTCCVRRFLDAVRPSVVALVENEVWPNFTGECKRRGIAVCVINGRLSQHSFGRYRMIRPLAAPMYGRLAAAAVQTQTYADRFIALGTPAENVSVLDTMKWDTADVADHVEGSDALAAAMGIDRSRPIIVAGSTGPGEEQMLIDTCPRDSQLVIVPRKPERFEQVAQLTSNMVRRTQHPNGAARPLDDTRLFLLDTMGELRKAYALADVVLVGRSFLGLYGSDMMEPAALGKPTIIGMHHADFADTVEALHNAGGIEITDNPSPLAAELLQDRTRAADLASRGRQVIRARQGATDKHVQMLMTLL